MDTIYYTLSTRRVKVCGGPDMVRFVPVAGVQPAREGKGRGEILDLDLCKKRLETKNAWKDFARMTADAPDLPGEEEAEEAPIISHTHREKGASLLELGATAAVLLAGLSAAAAFLSVL